MRMVTCKQQNPFACALNLGTWKEGRMIADACAEQENGPSSHSD